MPRDIDDVVVMLDGVRPSRTSPTPTSTSTGVPTSAPPTRSWSPATCTPCARRSGPGAPTPAPAPAGSWTPTCCAVVGRTERVGSRATHGRRPGSRGGPPARACSSSAHRAAPALPARTRVHSGRHAGPLRTTRGHLGRCRARRPGPEDRRGGRAGRRGRRCARSRSSSPPRRSAVRPHRPGGRRVPAARLDGRLRAARRRVRVPGEHASGAPGRNVVGLVGAAGRTGRRPSWRTASSACSRVTPTRGRGPGRRCCGRTR